MYFMILTHVAVCTGEGQVTTQHYYLGRWINTLFNIFF